MTQTPATPPGASSNPVGSARTRAAWRRRPALWIAGALALIVIAAAVVFGREPAADFESAAPPQRQRVTVATVGPRTFDVGLQVTGLLAARDEVAIGSAAPGQRVAAVLVDVGDTVAAGQLLARLETDTLAAQVLQGDAAVARAHAAIAQAQAAESEAQANLRRAEALSGTSVLSGQQIDERRAAALTASAAVEAARSELSGAEAQRAQARAELARTEIRAPSAGVISARTARVGALAGGEEPLFRLIRGGQVEFLAEVPERALPQVQEGQTVVLTVNGIDRLIQGRVRVVEPTIDPQSRLAIVRVALPATSDLRSGAFARGRVELGERSFEIAVPEAALARRSGDRASVMIVGRTGEVAARPVRIGGTQDGLVEVVSGLRPGERVVQNAGAFLRDGDAIEPVLARVAATGAAR